MLDISDPAQPEAIGTLELDLSAISLALSGDDVYVLTRGQLEPGVSIDEIPWELLQIDISGPESPEVIAKLTDFPGGLPGHLQSLVAGDGVLYFLKQNHGIQVISIE